MIPLMNEGYESYLIQVNFNTWKKKFEDKYTTKIIVKLVTTVIIQVNTEVLHIAYVV